jgi:GNAT superfamily N-acetyltransferase
MCVSFIRFHFFTRAGVLVGWVEERNAIECVSLVGVAPSAMGKGLGKALMQAVFARAEEAGKRSVRLTVNEHSTQSLPFYLSLGLSVCVCVGFGFGVGIGFWI